MADSAALVFNALSGPELVKVILADIEKKLVATGEFDGNITFPWVKYNYQISMVSYPKQPADSEPVLVTSGVGGSTEAIPSEAKADEVKETIVVNEVTVDTPDLARIESDQPIPTPGRGPGNVLIDKPVVPPAPKSDKRPFGYKGMDGKGKDGTGNQSAS